MLRGLEVMGANQPACTHAKQFIRKWSKWAERQEMRYPFKTVFAKITYAKPERTARCALYPYHPASMIVNIFSFLLLSSQIISFHHIFSPWRQTLSMLSSWGVHFAGLDIQKSMFLEPEAQRVASRLGRWLPDGLEKEQLPWWSSSTAWLWEMVPKMQPRICFCSSSRISVNH